MSYDPSSTSSSSKLHKNSVAFSVKSDRSYCQVLLSNVACAQHVGTLKGVSPLHRRVAFGSILLLAAAARLWGLAEYPPGLFPDQAANGEDALEILDGRLQVFSPRNNGRESLFFYVQALTVGLFGIGVWQIFLGSALVGIATVAATYAAGRRVLGVGPSLLAAFFLATNPWHVTLSRTGFRAVTAPLFIALALLCIARVLKPREGVPRRRDAVLAGLFTGLGLYTYASFRAFIVFLLICGSWALVRAAWVRSFRSRVRALAFRAGLAAFSASVVVAPLLVFFARHPDFVVERAAHVSIFNPELNDGSPLRTFVRVSGRTLRAFVVEGDGNPRHNVPRTTLPYRPGGRHDYEGGGEPFLSPLPALLAILGAGVALRRSPWLLVLLAVMLLPAVTTAEGIPHGLRTSGAIPAHVWLAGLGGTALLRRVRRLPSAGGRSLVVFGAAAALFVSAATDLGLYLGVARNSPLAHYEYRGDLTIVSGYLNRRARAEGAGALPPRLVLDAFSAKTVHFLTTPTEHPYRLIRPETSDLFPLAPGEEIIFTQSTRPDATRFRETYPSVVAREELNRFGETVMVVLRRP